MTVVLLSEAKGKIMHQLTPIEPVDRISRVMFWSGAFLVAAGVMTWFGVKLALRSEFLGWFLLFCVWMCVILVWHQLHRTPQGTLAGNPLQVIKFVFARALHGTILETPELSISDKILCVGQQFTIVYQQRFNQPARLTLFTVSLIFREELRQPSGEGDEVDTIPRTIQTYLRGLEDISGGLFYDKRAFTIPEDGIPSFTTSLKGSATHTGKWLVRVRMEPSDLPVFKNEYEIYVGSVGAKNRPQPPIYKGWWSHIRYRFADESDL